MAEVNRHVNYQCVSLIDSVVHRLKVYHLWQFWGVGVGGLGPCPHQCQSQSYTLANFNSLVTIHILPHTVFQMICFYLFNLTQVIDD